MSTLGAIYKSMAGLMGFTRALDNLSDNVANVNTPGFKGRDVFIRDLTDPSAGGEGRGVDVTGDRFRFAQGDISETGNATDLAIDGNGFFVLRDGERIFLSRNGQFSFQGGDHLVEPATGYRVAGLNSAGQLVDISLDSMSVSDPQPTTSVSLAGNLSSSAAVDAVYPPDTDTPLSFTLVDALGGSHELHLEFSKLSGNQWLAQARDASGNDVGNAHTVSFQADGSIVPASAVMEVVYQQYRVLSAAETEEALTASGPHAVSSTLDAVPAFDVSMSGGFSFAARQDGLVTFLQSGNFRFDAAGKLVDDASGLAVAARGPEGVLEDFSIEDLLVSAPTPTTNISLSGFLGADASAGDTVPADPATSPYTVSVVDRNGDPQTLRIVFTKVSATRWGMQVQDADGANIGALRNIDFSASGQVDAADQNISFTYTPPGSTSQTIQIRLGPTSDSTGLVQSAGTASTLNPAETDGRQEGSISEFRFDEAGFLQLTYANGATATGPRLAAVEDLDIEPSTISISFAANDHSNGVTGFTTASNATVAHADGRPLGVLTQAVFDREGYVVLNYSNGVSERAWQLALATVADPNDLRGVGETMFAAETGARMEFGTAGSGPFGELEPESLELSNVELSREFAEIIIVQRGYQASSQVLNVTNEMIQELYSSLRGG